MAKPHKSKPEETPASNDFPYVAIPGMHYDIPTDGLVRCRTSLPFACKRCMYQLQVQQNHNLRKGSLTPVICLGTCLDVIRGKAEAIAELKLTDEEATRIGNCYQIPDQVLANALQYDLKKGEIIDATRDLDARTEVYTGSEEAPDLDEGTLPVSGPELVRDSGPRPEAA